MCMYQQIDEVDINMYPMIDKYIESVYTAGTKPQDSTSEKMITYFIRHMRTGVLVHSFILRMYHGAQFYCNSLEKVAQPGVFVDVLAMP